MLGFGALGESPLGAGPSDLHAQIEKSAQEVSLTISGLILPDHSLIVPEQKVAEGTLIKSTAAVWKEIANRLANDWSLAMQLNPTQWEEMVAGAFEKEGFDEVILTPRSGDNGKDVIAVRKGVGAIRILDSVKRYKPGHLVTKEEVHALMGVVGLDQNASKGILTTTSDFAPRLLDDPNLAKAVPYRIELMNGRRLQEWLKALTARSK